MALLTNGLYVGRNEVRLAQAFTDGPAVSTDERIAFDRLAQLVEPRRLVMNDPYDGSAMMWALDNVQPVFASPLITPQELPTMDPTRPAYCCSTRSTVSTPTLPCNTRCGTSVSSM